MLLLATLLACGETAEPKDTAPVDSSDTGTTDTEDTVDTDPGTASIGGAVVGYDGARPAGMEVQVCDQLCIPVTTDADGNFVASSLDGGSYKVDALGEGVDGASYGRIRVHLDLEPGQSATIPYPLYMPNMSPPFTLTNGANVLGPLTWTVDPATLDAPFGFEEGVVQVGFVEGANVPPAWETPAAPVGALAFLPFGTEVSARFSFAISAPGLSGDFDVYSVDAKGKLEGPVGSASSEGGTLSGDAQPTLLTWLLLVPR
jgi:hypothetical protein